MFVRFNFVKVSTLRKIFTPKFSRSTVEGILSSKLPSSAIASANSEVHSVIDSNRHPPFSNTSLFGTTLPHAAFKCKNYYQSRREICQTFFRQIDFFVDSPNFNSSKLSSFTIVLILHILGKLNKSSFYTSIS